MITNLDKYIEVLEGREEELNCYLYQKRTKEVEGCHARYHKTQIEFLQLPTTKEMPFKMLENNKMYDIRALGL